MQNVHGAVVAGPSGDVFTLHKCCRGRRPSCESRSLKAPVYLQATSRHAAGIVVWQLKPHHAAVPATAVVPAVICASVQLHCCRERLHLMQSSRAASSDVALHTCLAFHTHAFVCPVLVVAVAGCCVTLQCWYQQRMLYPIPRRPHRMLARC